MLLGRCEKVDVVAWDSCALSGTRNSKRENWRLIEIEELRGIYFMPVCHIVAHHSISPLAVSKCPYF